jgi:hypothetical protein
MGAFAGERDRNGVADAARASGDQRDAGRERSVFRCSSGIGKFLSFEVTDKDMPT